MMNQTTAAILRNIVVYSIYLAAFFIPIFYLPITQDPLFARQTAFIVISTVAILAWLSRILITREVRHKTGILSVALGIFILIELLSSIFSISPSLSFFAPDPTGGQFLSFVAFIIISFLIASEFSREEAERLMAVILSGGALYSLLLLIQIIQLINLPLFFIINPSGSLNNAALLLSGFFILSICFCIFRKKELNHGWIFTRLAWFVLVFSAANLILINSTIVWIGLAVTTALLVAFHASRTLFQDRIGFAVLFLILVVAVIFAILPFNPESLISGIKTEIGVAPSLKATLAIAIDVLKSNPLLGSGPGTFIYDYSQFKPAAVNQTVFWNSKFDNGFSFVSTAMATTGILGILAILLFMITVASMLWRILKSYHEDDPVVFGYSSISLVGMIMWFIYPSTFQMNAFIFIALGGLVASAHQVVMPAYRFFSQGTTLKILKVDNQTFIFLSALVATTALISAIWVDYLLIRKYMAEIYFNQGLTVFSSYGNIDTALVRFDSAINADPSNAKYFLSKSQLYLVRTQNSINNIVAGKAEAQSEFRSNMNAALESARSATSLNPRDAANWLNLGIIYETALPIIDGADRFAISAYEEAHAREPANPVPLTFIGRSYLEFADLIELRMQRGIIPNKDGAPVVKNAVAKSREYLERSVNLKSDYANAQFLFAQVLSREGNIDDAIRRGANAALAAPQDVGIAFFLGFLLYQKNLLGEAEDEFSRAVTINPNYSNARYFLGLIYDRTNRKGEALKQFRAIRELNPDNDEVKKIISNLEAGRTALASVPPPPPEKRKELPVKDTTAKPRK